MRSYILVFALQTKTRLETNHCSGSCARYGHIQPAAEPDVNVPSVIVALAGSDVARMPTRTCVH
jgi:hypothetical protein